MKKDANPLLESLTLLATSLRVVTVMIALLGLTYSIYTAPGGGAFFAGGVLGGIVFYTAVIYFFWVRRLKGVNELSSKSEVRYYLRKVTVSSSILMLLMILIAANLIVRPDADLSILHVNLITTGLVVTVAVSVMLCLVGLRISVVYKHLKGPFRSFTAEEYALTYSEVKDWLSLAVVVVTIMSGMALLVVDEPVRDNGADSLDISVAEAPFNKYTDGPPDPVEILELVNQERERVGVAPLEMIPEMNQSAQDKVNDMATYGYFGHENNDGSRGYDYIPKRTGYLCSYVNENIASGHENSSQVVQDWIDSDSHYHAMIDPDYRYTGLAVGSGLHDGQPEHAWLIVHHFCK